MKDFAGSAELNKHYLHVVSLRECLVDSQVQLVTKIELSNLN